MKPLDITNEPAADDYPRSLTSEPLGGISLGTERKRRHAAAEHRSKHRMAELRVVNPTTGSRAVVAEWNATQPHPWKRKRIRRAAAKAARASRKKNR